jgi:LacI family transcriptional regulator
VKTRKRVALAFPMGLAFIERLQQGILEYARQHGGWSLLRQPEMLSPAIGWLKHWSGHGAFVLVTSPADARLALAAQHLIERRFRRCGFYGTRGKWYSDQRRAGFLDAVEAAGATCSVLEVDDLSHGSHRWIDQQRDLEGWLRRLQPPVGIMAATDLRASMVLEACVHLGLRVPEEMALIGVDNDPVACEFCHPPLSSVRRNDREVGAQAAALLDRLMRGGRAPDAPLLAPPDGVAARASTNTLAIEDDSVAAAVREVQAHLDEPFGVERLVGPSGLSRRRLERRFRLALGRSPYAFINEQRVARARQLLAAAEKRTLSQIALLCGFRELRRFRLVFARLTGLGPNDYRRSKR